MIQLKCSKCKTKLLKYKKIGKGHLLKCIKSRIINNYMIKNLNNYYCSKCNNKIGIDKGVYIKMIKKSFTEKGSRD